MKAVALDPTEVGSFYNGDSYLVLDNRGEMGADIHMWIGESGANVFTTSGMKSKALRFKGEVAAHILLRCGMAAGPSETHQRFLFYSCQSANLCPPLTLLHAHRWLWPAGERLIIDPSPVTHETRC